MNKYVAMLSLLTFRSVVFGEAISVESVGAFRVSPYLGQLVKIEMRKGAAEDRVPPQINLNDSHPLQRAVHTFLEKNNGKKLGMVIGRGNVQGVADFRIQIDSLKGLKWLFVDPGDSGVDGWFHNNQQDETLGNALNTTWPVDFSLAGLFDAVVVDLWYASIHR
jgi:hypothetical protein